MYQTSKKALFVFSFQVIMIPDFLLSNSDEIFASIASFMSFAAFPNARQIEEKVVQFKYPNSLFSLKKCTTWLL